MRDIQYTGCLSGLNSVVDDLIDEISGEEISTSGQESSVETKRVEIEKRIFTCPA